jgi:hypothetical protein
MKKILMFCLLITVTNNVSAIPTLTEVSATGTTVKFVTKLSEKLPTGYKVKIDYGNGKGLVPMTCSGLNCSLSSNALPDIDWSIYKVGIYNARGFLQQEEFTHGYYLISSVTTVYTKISNSGAPLPDTAIPGSSINNWACTKDNKTGLIWEVKTIDGGLRDVRKKYTNYFFGENGYGLNTNTDVFVEEVNKKTLCGASNWRLPTIDELMTLVYCSNGRYESSGACTNTVRVITISTGYFPYTQTSSSYWSSSPDNSYNNFGWGVEFSGGYSNNLGKSNLGFVRLVR